MARRVRPVRHAGLRAAVCRWRAVRTGFRAQARPGARAQRRLIPARRNAGSERLTKPVICSGSNVAVQLAMPTVRFRPEAEIRGSSPKATIREITGVRSHIMTIRVVIRNLLWKETITKSRAFKFGELIKLDFLERHNEAWTERPTEEKTW